MKIKKFIDVDESSVIEKVKAELGENVIIVSIKKIKKRNFLGFYKKKFLVQATVAYDFKINELENKNLNLNNSSRTIVKNNIDNSNNSKTKDTIENASMEISNKLRVFNYKYKADRVYDNNILQLFYEALILQGVLEDIVREVLDDALLVSSFKNIDINLVTKIVYNNIVNVLNRSCAKVREYDKYNVIIFIGPTGVGKTTTIAKLCSRLILNDSMSVALITSDTYRIAAVDQLKTYADILDIDIEVAYEKDDILKNILKLSKNNDLIFIDTAGRSQKNVDNISELNSLISNIKNTKIYLVISCTTKYEDIVSIINTFSSRFIFDIIITKLDETMTYGCIFNICYKTNIKIAYITNGQNVPDDLELMNSEKIAKILLGLGDI